MTGISRAHRRSRAYRSEMTLAAGTIKLVPLTAAVIHRRLAEPEFSATVIGIDRPVQFAREWPGDLLGMFPIFASALTGNEAVLGQYIIVDTNRAVAVGALGILGEVTPARSVEIGYGMNSSERGRGFATVAVGLLVQGLFTRRVLPARVGEITAKTAVGNIASQRVLEKNNFLRAGIDWSDEDGDLITWSLQP